MPAEDFTSKKLGQFTSPDSHVGVGVMPGPGARKDTPPAAIFDVAPSDETALMTWSGQSSLQSALVGSRKHHYISTSNSPGTCTTLYTHAKGTAGPSTTAPVSNSNGLRMATTPSSARRHRVKARQEDVIDVDTTSSMTSKVSTPTPMSLPDADAADPTSTALNTRILMLGDKLRRNNSSRTTCCDPNKENNIGHSNNNNNNNNNNGLCSCVTNNNGVSKPKRRRGHHMRAMTGQTSNPQTCNTTTTTSCTLLPGVQRPSTNATGDNNSNTDNRGSLGPSESKRNPVTEALKDILCLSYAGRGASTVAIDNKIEQAMDLVKSHLMFAVREEVLVLKEQIKDLLDKNTQLESENYILRKSASPETLAKLSQQAGNTSAPPSGAGGAQTQSSSS